MYVTEDTVRAHPTTLRSCSSQRSVAARKVLPVRHRRPRHTTGAANLVRFAKGVVLESGTTVELDGTDTPIAD